MLHIEWRHDGRQPLFPVRILQPKPSNDVFGVETIALLDTGSTTSGVTEALAGRLALKGIGKRPLVSARSFDQAERYLFRVGIDAIGSNPGALPFVFEAVIGLEPKSGFRFEALIGMDILAQCDLTLRRDGSCTLAFG